MIFKNYAALYDALYGDKDYRAECAFVKRVFDVYGEKIRTVLDLGCGTGSHALVLAEMGYPVTGIDLSQEMLDIAAGKAREQGKQVDFVRGDIRHIDLPRKFDAAVAMFTVMGYMTTNEDMDSAVKAVRKHLRPGSLFVFDVWFGPAVLNEKPSERIKKIEMRGERIIRTARPTLDILRQTVRVDYSIIQIAGDRVVAEIEESHLVRFFFYQELASFLERNGFAVLIICPFLDLDGQADERSWTVSVIGRAV